LAQASIDLKRRRVRDSFGRSQPINGSRENGRLL
jgi:hypothetical protein